MKLNKWSQFLYHEESYFGVSTTTVDWIVIFIKSLAEWLSLDRYRYGYVCQLFFSNENPSNKHPQIKQNQTENLAQVNDPAMQLYLTCNTISNYMLEYAASFSSSPLIITLHCVMTGRFNVYRTV